MVRVRGIGVARRSTVRVCDKDGEHVGQGLLLDMADEGTFVLTCHHITALLPPDGVFVRLPQFDGRLGVQRLAVYDHARSCPVRDAVVLRLDGVCTAERPLLHKLDPATYDGNLTATVLTHTRTTSFDASVSVADRLRLRVPVPDERMPDGSSYDVPQSFRLMRPTDARRGVSGGVVICDGGVLGLVQSARASNQEREAEAYLLPLSAWADGWSALAALIEDFASGVGNSYDYALQDYLRAVRIFAANDPYLALDSILVGAGRSSNKVYVPLNVHAPRPLAEAGDYKTDREPHDERAGQAACLTTTVPLEVVLRGASANASSGNVLLRGGAGAGKSTLLRYIAGHAWDRPHLLGLPRACLPIVIRLQNLANVQGASVEERLLNALRRAGDLPLLVNPPQGFFSEWSRRENVGWLLMLDGLDEVSAVQHAEVLRWIEDLLRLPAGTHQLILLTSRPASAERSRSPLTQFDGCDLLPFDEPQRREFAERWFGDAADDFLEKVVKIGAGDLFRHPLTLTPLMLTIAAAVYRRDGDLPEEGQSQLFGEFIDILFDEVQRRGLGDELGGDLAVIAREGVERFALAMIDRPAENSLADMALVGAEFLREEFGWGGARLGRHSERFAEVLSRRSGVMFVQDGVCQWVHPSLRDYLAAQALSRSMVDTNGDYSAVIGDRVFEVGAHDMLLDVSRSHPDRRGLIRWMSEQARTRMNASAALLVLDCWQEGEVTLRDELHEAVVRALASGLGDDQSGLYPRTKLRGALVGMGRAATTPLTMLLEELGEPDETVPQEQAAREETDAREESEGRARAMHSARRRIINVLGDIGDERAVAPLLALLPDTDENDYRRNDLARTARRALRCIGRPAVAPLLARIEDASLTTDLRCEYLRALEVVGVRTDETTKTLDLCLREGSNGEPKLLAFAIHVVRNLRDRAFVPLIIRALNSGNPAVVAQAALYFAQVPDESALPALKLAFARWRTQIGGAFDLRRARAELSEALINSGEPEALGLVLDFFKTNLREDGRLVTDAIMREAEDVQPPELAALGLRELAHRLTSATPGHAVPDLLDRLAVTWRPQHTAALASTARELEVDAQNRESFADQLVADFAITQSADEGDSSLRSRLDPGTTLGTLVKCRVPRLTALAGRLLSGASYSLKSEIFDVLWVAGDPAAEGLLLAELRSPTRSLAQADRPSPEEYDALRALTTCGTEGGAQEALEYIRENPDLSIYMPQEVLCPLVRRGIVNTDTISSMALDTTGTHEFVRRACVEALLRLNPSGFTDVFLGVVATETDDETRAYAATALGWSKTERERVVARLADELTTTSSPFVASRAAQSLVRLRAPDALSTIERAVERFGGGASASGLLRAAARLRRRSTRGLLDSALSETRRGWRVDTDVIAAFGEYYASDEAARGVVSAQLERSQAGIDMNQQHAAVKVLAGRDPDRLLSRAAQLYDAGRLEASACLTLTNLLPRLSKLGRVDKTLLVEVMKRLLCDVDLNLRERMGESLEFIAPAPRRRAYEELRTARDEWMRACAVYSLAFCDGDASEIETARFDSSPVVRRLAEVARVLRSKRAPLRQVAHVFRTSAGVERASAYLSLSEQGGESLVDVLYRDTREEDAARLFLRELESRIEHRVKNDRKKRDKHERETICGRARR